MSGKNQKVEVKVKEDKKGDIHINVKLMEKEDKIKLDISKANTLEDAMLRVDTIGVEEVKSMLGKEMFNLEVHPVPDTVFPGGPKVPNDHRYVTVRPIRIDGLNIIEDGILVNSDFVVKEGMSGTISKVEDLLLEDETEAIWLAGLLTNVEIAKAELVLEHATKALKFLNENREAGRY